MKRIYLSIDIDYWNRVRFPAEWFDLLLRRRVPVLVVWDHDQLVPNVLEHQWDTLYNIDEHSDLVDTRSVTMETVTDGDWVNLVARPGARYVWACPDWEYCYLENNGFCHNSLTGGKNPFQCRDPEKVCGWEWTEAREGFRTLKLDRVIAIGISISPSWTDPHILMDFHSWLDRHYRQVSIMGRNGL